VYPEVILKYTCRRVVTSFKTKTGSKTQHNYFTGISGLLLKRLANDTTVVQSTEVLCVAWYHDTIHMKENITAYSQKLPQCPCDLTSMSFDPWWKWKTVEEEDRVCYYLWQASTFDTYGKVGLIPVRLYRLR